MTYQSSLSQHVGRHYGQGPARILYTDPGRPAEAPNTHGGDWTLAFTGPRAEHLASEHLERAGYLVFCPMMTKWVRSGRRVSRQHRPLFPRYLFVCPSESAARSISDCRDVQHVVRHDGRHAIIRHQVVRAISDEQARGSYDHTDHVDPRTGMELACRRFPIGTFVEFEDGPYAGILGARIVAIREDKRVELLINLLGSERKVAVDANLLRKAS